MKNVILHLLMGLISSAYGATGTSPSIDVPITISSSGPAIPAVAASAGFTTLARNYDFSQPLYANQSNWLDCSGTNTDPKYEWHFAVTGYSTPLPCNIFQATDPATGQTVLRLQYLNSYKSFGQSSQSNYVVMQTHARNGINAWVDFPNMYLEYVHRIDNTFGTVAPPQSGPNGVYTWSAQAQAIGGGPIEWDPGELYGSSGGYGNGAMINHANSGFRWFWRSYSTNNLPSGWRPSDYHKYGLLITSNGSSIIGCNFVDDKLQSCGDAGATAQQATWRTYLIEEVGTQDPSNGNMPDTDLYVQYIRVWTCGNWPLPVGQPSTLANMCNGNSLFSGTQDGQTLSYYH